jgi:hypothetical protein
MAKQRFGNELHPLYTRWLSTTQRCRNPKHASYKNYGARGISMTEEFTNFTTYCDYVTALSGYDPVNASLDRINNDGNYEPGNLRWVTYSHQIANQRFSGKGNNKYIGVSWSNFHKIWVARINFKGKTLMSSTFTSEIEALIARNVFIVNNKLPHTVQSI